jgi:hypothetical protein
MMDNSLLFCHRTLARLNFSRASSPRWIISCWPPDRHPRTRSSSASVHRSVAAGRCHPNTGCNTVDSSSSYRCRSRFRPADRSHHRRHRYFRPRQTDHNYSVRSSSSCCRSSSPAAAGSRHSNCPADRSKIPGTGLASCSGRSTHPSCRADYPGTCGPTLRYHPLHRGLTGASPTRLSDVAVSTIFFSLLIDAYSTFG